MKHILVLCTGNSCRSQMVHGYLNALLGDEALIFSAGIETHGLNPDAVAIMKEDGIDISRHTSDHVNDCLDLQWDYIITVCDHAREHCPYIPSPGAKRIHQNFPDPSLVQGTESERHKAFLVVRNRIRDFCRDFVAGEIH